MKKFFTLLLATLLSLALCAFLPSCHSGTAENEIVVGATSVPHAEILEQIRDDVQKRGYKLVIRVFASYTEINGATQDGTLDANYFQHQPYLDDFLATEGGTLVSAGTVHYEPLGIYPNRKKVTELDGLKTQTQKTVLIPNDKTNEARALQLLAQEGLITVDETKGLSATKADVTANPYNFVFREVSAEQIADSLSDAAIAVVNGNYALSAGFTVNDALAVEDAASEAADLYANIVAVKRENLTSEKTQVLMECLQSEKVRTYIAQKYGSSVVAKFN